MSRSHWIPLGFWAAMNVILWLTAYQPWAEMKRDIRVHPYQSPDWFQFSEDSRAILLYCEGQISRRDLETGEERLVIAGNFGLPLLLSDGDTLIANQKRLTLQAWSSGKGKKSWETPFRIPWASQMALTPRENIFAWYEAADLTDCKAKLFLVTSLPPLARSPPDLSHPIVIDLPCRPDHLLFTPSGEDLVIIDAHGQLSVLNLATLPRTHGLSLSSSFYGIDRPRPLLFLDADHLLAGNAIISTKTWTIESVLLTLDEESWKVTAAAARGDLVYLGTSQGKVYRMNWKTREVSRPIAGSTAGSVKRVVISPDGKWLATTGKGQPPAGLFRNHYAADDHSTHLWRLSDPSHD